MRFSNGTIPGAMWAVDQADTLPLAGIVPEPAVLKPYMHMDNVKDTAHVGDWWGKEGVLHIFEFCCTSMLSLRDAHAMRLPSGHCSPPAALTPLIDRLSTGHGLHTV